MAPSSALSEALNRIGDRWSLVIVDALMDGPLRFADLHHRVDGISTNILAARLRHLEGQAVVMAMPYSRRPLRFYYDLTDAGRDLAGAARMLAQWSADHAGPHGTGLGSGGAGPGGAGTGPGGGGTGPGVGRMGPGGGGTGAGRGVAGAGTPLHSLCGTSMVAVWWCPTCDQVSGTEPGDLVWV